MVQAGGLLLAGGRSTRMDGKHKGELIYQNQSFVEHMIEEFRKETEEILLSYGTEIRKEYPRCRIVMDEYPGCGPIGGIHAGFKNSRAESVMVSACDMPFLTIGLYRYLQDELGKEERKSGKYYGGIVPVTEGKIHPLAAIYRKRPMEEIVKEQIENGNYRLTDALKKADILYIDLTAKKELRQMLRNINTIAEYEELISTGREEVRQMEPLSLEHARKMLLDRVEKIEETEKVSLWDAGRRCLAEDIRATRNQPPFPRSPLDGYAVRSENIKGADENHPVRLTVIDEVTAGHVTKKQVTDGTAVRIMTGAPVPEGADCIVGQEDTDYGEEEVLIFQAIGHYENYCFEGEDYQKGTCLLEKGTMLGAVETGVLASLGVTKVLVYRRAKAALITTGDEIVLPGEELKEGKIYDSNLYTLGTQLASWDIDVTCKKRAGDNAGEVARMLEEAAEDADILITTGGVSVGKKDIMHDVLKVLDCERIFWRIAVKPGMPTLCASYKGKLLICLSGNPFGATVNLELLVRPLFEKMTGRSELALIRKEAVAQNAFPKKSGVTRYVRAYYEEGTVRVADGSNASGILSSMCGCNCLIEIPAGTKSVEEGDRVWVVLI